MIRLFSRPKPIDWNARLEADRALRERFIGKPFQKKREAAKLGTARKAGC